MTSHPDESGGSRHRTPGTGTERDDPAGAGVRPGPRSATDRPAPRAAAPTGAGNGNGDAHTHTDPSGHSDAVGNDTGESALDAARRERDEYLDMLRRVQADFENYKKRMQRQQSDQLERASEQLVTKLLPALDAFDLSVAHLSETEAASPEVKALLQASGLVVDALAKEGLERIDDPGAAFDPTMHDAVEHAPAQTGSPVGGADVGETTPSVPVVADVLRSGYRWKGRVIRPAMVRVRG